jgi:hypothetical protein
MGLAGWGLVHLAAGKTATITVKLNGRGKADLRAGHGRLNATLAAIADGQKLT